MTPAIVTVARSFGLDPRKPKGHLDYKCNCPFHEPADDSKSLMFTRDCFGWFFKCWKCGANGRDDEALWTLMRRTKGKEAKDGEALPE